MKLLDLRAGCTAERPPWSKLCAMTLPARLRAADGVVGAGSPPYPAFPSAAVPPVLGPILLPSICCRWRRTGDVTPCVLLPKITLFTDHVVRIADGDPRKPELPRTLPVTSVPMFALDRSRAVRRSLPIVAGMMFQPFGGSPDRVSPHVVLEAMP